MAIDPRFLVESGREIFTGNELLVKGALETEGGVHLLTGYPGSPVAGFFDVCGREGVPAEASVTTRPGLTTLLRMPSGPHSLASWRDSMTTPALLTLYAPLCPCAC